MWSRLRQLTVLTRSRLGTPAIQRNAISTTIVRNDLKEFFDDEKNWGANEVKSGRSWTKDDLRLKSNTDLHKLWFVLLKERNMLLTMEEEAKQQIKLFPSPERIDKVADSMENLETVVRERNEAYHKLETGETGERPAVLRNNIFGLRTNHRMVQYPIPEYLNANRKDIPREYRPNRDTELFLVKYKEKMYISKKRKAIRDFNHVIGLLNRFPNMDVEALKAEYPDVDIEKAKRSRKYKGAWYASKKC